MLIRAAAIWEPPILRPTIFFALLPGSEVLETEGFGRGRRSIFDFGFDSALGFDAAGSAASHCFAERLNEKSRL